MAITKAETKLRRIEILRKASDSKVNLGMGFLEDLIGFLIAWSNVNGTISITEHSTVHTKDTAVTDLFLARLLHTEPFPIASDLHNDVLPTGQNGRMPVLQLGSQWLDKRRAVCFSRFLGHCLGNINGRSKAGCHERSIDLRDRGSGQSWVQMRYQDFQSGSEVYQSQLLSSEWNG
jgi:hypothetical protein